MAVQQDEVAAAIREKVVSLPIPSEDLETQGEQFLCPQCGEYTVVCVYFDGSVINYVSDNNFIHVCMNKGCDHGFHNSSSDSQSWAGCPLTGHEQRPIDIQSFAH
jgi:hypothetical protein